MPFRPDPEKLGQWSQAQHRLSLHLWPVPSGWRDRCSGPPAEYGQVRPECELRNIRNVTRFDNRLDVQFIADDIGMRNQRLVSQPVMDVNGHCAQWLPGLDARLLPG